MLNKEILEKLKKVKVKVLRNKFTGQALGVSYTEEGLMLISNKKGRLLAYKNAYLKRENDKVIIVGNTSRNPNVIVEDFKPRRFNNPEFNKHEILWIDKALKLHYNL